MADQKSQNSKKKSPETASTNLPSEIAPRDEKSLYVCITDCAKDSKIMGNELGENCNFEIVKVKEEIIDEEVLSHESEINPPCIPTRLKWKLFNRRKSNRTGSSASSNVESCDTRKAKSEPIVIELSDSSDDECVPVINSRPNRLGRVQGQIIRKLSKIEFRNKTKVTSYKDSSDSSSDDEKARRNRKTRRFSIQASSSKKKKFLQAKRLRLVNNSGFKLKKAKRKLQVSQSIVPVGTRALTKSQYQLKPKNISRRLTKPSIMAKTYPKRNIGLMEKEKSVQDIRKSKRNSCSDTEKSITQDLKNIAKKYSAESEVSAEDNKKKIKNNSSESEDNKKKTRNNSSESEFAVSEENKKKTRNNSTESEFAILEDTKRKVDTKPLLLADTKNDSTESQNVNPHEQKRKIKNKRHFSGSDSEISQDIKLITKGCFSESETLISQDNQMAKNNSTESGSLINEVDKSTINCSLPFSKLERKPGLISEDNTKMSTLIDKESIDTSKSDDHSQPRTKKSHKKKRFQFDERDDISVRKRGRPRKFSLASSDSTSSREVKKVSITDLSQPPFIQNSFCFDVVSKLPKCRECRIAVHKNSKKMLNSYCRFMEYRKLCVNKAGTVLNAGFSKPSDAAQEHLKVWLPQTDDPPRDLNKETARALLEHIGDQFCDLIEQEREAQLLHVGRDKTMTWKRIVQGVREMCDVCYTTIFNVHWVCPICGLAVCIDCYKMRKQGIIIEDEDSQSKDRDEFKWLLCSLRQIHVQNSLVMAQIIPGKALWSMQKLLHDVRKEWNIPAYCKCNLVETNLSEKKISTGICKQLICSLSKSFSSERNNVSNFGRAFHSVNIKSDIDYDGLDVEINDTAMKWLEESNYNFYDSSFSPMCGPNENFHDTEDFAPFRSLLLQDTKLDRCVPEPERVFDPFSTTEIAECMTNSHTKDGSEKSMLKHFSHRLPQPSSGRDPLPIRVYTHIESNLSFSDVPHSWLCNGRLLLLDKPQHKNNLTLFQEQWKRGQPILVKGVDKRLDMSLWHPDGFCRDFGEIKNDLVNCKTGAVLKNLPMKRFWEGFENFSKRMKDDEGEYMLLKLKDWPPGEDFSEKLPKRFHDLMKGLPLPEYTHRNGVLNLAGRLPPWFVRPDLGPKMYNAYGSALYPTKGTTNLHLDISDAVNVMVYVGIPGDGNSEQHIQAALKAIDEGGCDSLMRKRVRENGAKPGALWHIYNARDTDKIREMLNKVALEQGEKLEANNDPIHDQSWYIDTELRKRLYQDYGVEGYAIAQCLGDAVFIPAGAPHQVRNLHSCVKVAEDFVSPENIAHCFKLTQEFRYLSDTHTNHEDKLQIKNIIYHVVRDALAHLVDSDTKIDKA